jgi:NTE family protein
MKPYALLGRSPLFARLNTAELEELGPRLKPHSFEPGQEICHAGDPGDSLFVLEDGLAHVLSDDGRVVAKLRRGDVVGEMSLVTGEPRSATVVAALPTEVLELRQDHFAEAIGRSPQLLTNLNRILSQRLAATTAQVGVTRSRGEAVLLITAPGVDAREIVEATRAAKVGTVATVDAASLAALDDLVAEHALVLITAHHGQEGLDELVNAADRTVEVTGSEDVARVGRHLARTKLGLALGAGGAKGYAHVGLLRVLEQAGYTVDCVAGSSIGAIVGALVGLGLSADEVDEALRRGFREEVVAEIFKLSFSGTSSGTEAMTELLRELTQEKSFEELELPLAVMAVDLVGREATTIRSGPLVPALFAATSVAGLFPPFERDGQRLVDGIALVPVPTDAARELGADIVVSLNLIGRHVLPAWPGDDSPPEEPKPPGSRMLETLLEVMDLAQLDSSERHAARADVAITPVFGPCTWRDFHLADQFLEAGREAAEQALPALQALARPQLSRSST